MLNIAARTEEEFNLCLFIKTTVKIKLSEIGLANSRKLQQEANLNV